ncbi:hypothetical protein ACRCRN_06060, partial [Pseudomonas aeruginosa]
MRRYAEAFFEIVHWPPESPSVLFFSPRRSRTSHTTIPSIARAVQPWRPRPAPAPPRALGAQYTKKKKKKTKKKNPQKTQPQPV